LTYLSLFWRWEEPIRVITVGLLAMAIAGSAREARAQRPLRIALGETHLRQTFETFSFTGGSPSYRTENPRYLQIGISYDVLRRGKIGEQARIFGAAYYDGATNIDGYGGAADSGTYDPVNFAYSGGGFAIRAHNTFGYIGGGLGYYRGGVGGKLFAGLQGRGTTFTEIALTRTAHDRPASLAVLVGLRL